MHYFFKWFSYHHSACVTSNFQPVNKRDPSYRRMRSDSCITVWRLTESEIITFNLTVLSKRPRNPLAGLSVSERQIIPALCVGILRCWILILKEFYQIARWKEVTETCYFSRVYAFPGCWQLQFDSVPRYTYKIDLKIFDFRNHYFIPMFKSWSILQSGGRK